MHDDVRSVHAAAELGNMGVVKSSAGCLWQLSVEGARRDDVVQR